MSKQKSIDLAAQEFVNRHKKGHLNSDHIEKVYGSVEGYLRNHGSDRGDRGLQDIEIASWNHKDGWTDTVEWFEDTYQIGYYRLPIEERVTSEDHTPELNFNPDFDSCLDHIEELRAKGYCDISMHEVSEGEFVSEIRIEDYIDGFGEVV